MGRPMEDFDGEGQRHQVSNELCVFVSFVAGVGVFPCFSHYILMGLYIDHKK
jgi:hypothetical protein